MDFIIESEHVITNMMNYSHLDNTSVIAVSVRERERQPVTIVFWGNETRAEVVNTQKHVGTMQYCCWLTNKS